MTEAEMIRAAIEELEQQRKDVIFPTPWEHAQGVYDGMWDEEVRLIATLHRTIDVQLAILRNNLGGAIDIAAGHSPDEPASVDDALDLARAILGQP